MRRESVVSECLSSSSRHSFRRLSIHIGCVGELHQRFEIYIIFGILRSSEEHADGIE